MGHKKWVVEPFDKDLAAEISEEFNIDPFLALLLVTRGIKNYEDVDEFLNCELDLIDPFNIIDMDKAVQRIKTAIENNEKIAVYGDFDADGVTATAVVYEFLKSEGADVLYYIPNREGEGYGLNNDAIDNLHNQNVNLIITVDNGISAVEEAKYIKKLGMELVITDHHTPPEILPEAVAVVDPHRKDCDLFFRDWAGVGVAFKLITALYDGDVEELLLKYSDLVAIGTVGDIVPLIAENRSLVKFGLNMINLNQRVGLNAFRLVLNITDKDFTASDLAFLVVPRINAAGRMDDASRAVQLLTEQDLSDAEHWAALLNEANAERQSLEKEIVIDVENQILSDPELFKSRVIVVDGYNYHPGVIGIVASKIVDKFGKPCIIISTNDGEVSRGSCRSINGFSIYDALAYCKDELVRFGGHPLAAGLSINKKNINEFRRKINEYAVRNFEIMPLVQLKIDCKLSPVYITTELINNIAMLEPFGAYNSQPVFALLNMKLLSIAPVSDGKHLRLTVQKAGENYTVMLFGVTEKQFAYKIGDNLDIAVKISNNYYNGRNYINIHAVDIRLNGTQDDKYFKEKALYEKYLFNNLSNDGLKNLIPYRDTCVKVYKFLLANNGYSYGIDNLYFRLQNDLTYGQLNISLTAFCQLGLINMNNEFITVNKTASKVDLDSAQILVEIKGTVDNGK